MKKIKIQTNDKGQKFPSIVCTEPCPIERGMRILGGKWKASILWHLKDEPIRFNDLCRIMGGASKKMIPASKGDGKRRLGKEAGIKHSPHCSELQYY